jgi:hypothetical protein
LKARVQVRRIALAAVLCLAAGYVIWDRIEARGLARDIAAIAARGEPITDAPKPLELTAEQRQAARAYATAVERLQDEMSDDAFRYRRLDVDNPASSPPSLADLESRYRRDAPSLQLLDQATRLEFSGFGDVAPELDRSQEPLVALAALNDLRADLLSMRGKGEEAAGVLVASVRLQRAIPLSFYRYQSSIRLLGSVRVLLRQTSPAEPSLATLQHAFEALPDSDLLTREAMASRGRFVEAISRAPATLGDAVAERVLGPFSTRQRRWQLRTFDELVGLTRGPWPDRLDRAAVFERKFITEMKAQRQAFLARFISSLDAPFGGWSLTSAASDLAMRRVAISSLAVDRYRRAHGLAFPPTLEALVPAYLPAVPRDPFSGNPIVYRSVPGGWRVYCVDTNRTDDGGVFYGVGSRGQLVARAGAPRDFGLEIPSKPTR